MATVNSPLSQALGGAGLEDAGHRYNEFLVGGNVRLRLAETFTLRNLGIVVPFLQDLAGTTSDTARERYYDTIGASQSMASMAAENTAITPSTIEAEVEDVVLGRFGIGYEMTYTAQILGDDGEINMEKLAAFIALSYEATWMDTLASTITGFTGNVGQSGIDMTVDDLLAATYVFDLLEGGDEGLFGMFHGQQIRDLKQSFRAEPSLQFPDESKELLRQKGGPSLEFDIFGVMGYKSQRVTASGGNRIGAVWQPGAMKWVNGSTQRVRVAHPDQAIRMDDLGLLIEFGGASGTATSEVDANAFFGIAVQDDERGTKVSTDQ